MIRRGIPEAVAMRISGHKTREVFDSAIQHDFQAEQEGDFELATSEAETLN